MKIDRVVRSADEGPDSKKGFENLRVAIIGAGKMSALHLDTLKYFEGVRLVGICSRSQNGAASLAEKYGIEQTFNGPVEMIETAAPDAVVIAVSHHATVDIASLVLEGRIPCLIEKPAGYSVEETEKLATLADKNSCYNMVALNRRYYSVIDQAMLSVLHYGEIKGIHIEAHEPIQKYRDRQQFESWLYDSWLTANTIHMIDLFRMIGGDVAHVERFSRSRSEKFGDSFAAAIEFKNGILGTFSSHWNSAVGASLKIFGDGVIADLSPLEAGFLTFHCGHRIKLSPDWEDRTFKPGLFGQMKAFLFDVSEKRSSSFPASDLRDNVGTMRLLEIIQNN